MSRRAISTGSLLWLAIAAGIAACGRIGYLPEDLAPRDAAMKPGLVDAYIAADVRGTPDAPASDADATDATLGMDVEAQPGDEAMDVAADSPATGEDAAADAAPPEAEAASPPLDCGAACCCAYACAYGKVPSASGCGSSNDTAQYGFESGTQGWVVENAAQVLVPGATTATAAEVFAGSSSLAVAMNIPASSYVYATFQSPNLAPLAGAVVTFHVWLEAGAGLLAIQPYVMDKNYVWSGSYVELGQLVPGCWSTITVAVPSTFAAPAFQIGVQFLAPTGAAYTGTAYVDAVEW